MTYFGFTSLLFGTIAGAVLATTYIPCIAWPQKTTAFLVAYIIGEFSLAILIFVTGRTDRMLQAVYMDQILWMDLNKPLLRYILSKGEDPKVRRILSGGSLDDHGESE